VVLGDFFKHGVGAHRVDVIYERTFLSALPPDLWQATPTGWRNCCSLAEGLPAFFFTAKNPFVRCLTGVSIQLIY
jgi:hypothetical protein